MTNELLTAFAMHAAQHERVLLDVVSGLAGSDER
jgi:hypothetical protein